jgi:hypothetical protein
MDLSKIRLPITIIFIILAQGFGIVWYVAQLDSTVKGLSVTVNEIQKTQADSDIAVLKNEISNIKAIISKLESNTGESLIYDDSFIYQELEDLRFQIENLEPQDNKQVKELSGLISNILANKGSSWNKSKLKERLEALEDKTKNKKK